MSRHLKLKEELDNNGYGKMTCFGNSMEPIIKSGALLTFMKQEEYDVDDIVICKVKGRWIDAHNIIKKNEQRGYLIANNKGHENGWTHSVYGKVMM